MELLSFPIIIFLFTILLTSLTVFRRKDHSPDEAKVLPAPWMLPIIGNIHHLLGGMPHHRLTQLAAEHGPVYHLRLGQVNNVVVSSAEAVEEVMRTRENCFPGKPHLLSLQLQTYNYTNINFSPLGHYWRQLRKICTVELLTTKRVKSFNAVRNEEIASLISDIASRKGEKVNLTKRLMSVTNSITFRAVMGKRCRQEERFLAVMEEAIRLILGAQVVDLFPKWKGVLNYVTGTKYKLGRLFRELDEVLDEIVEEHEKELEGKGEKEEDMLDVLLRLKNGGKLELPLTMDNVKAVASELFGAGTDTSYATIEWAMAELMRNPDKMRKAQSEVRKILNGKSSLEDIDISQLTYLNLVVKETFRLHPPGPLLIRECSETCTVQGFEIPAGTRVINNIWAVGRDPKYWEDPDSFIPERFEDSKIRYNGTDFHYLPFGAGRRMCPGMTFGMATVETCLANLLCWFDWELPNGMKAEDIDMSEKFSAVVSRKSDLELVATAHNFGCN